jgi:hypothetical protein
MLCLITIRMSQGLHPQPIIPTGPSFAIRQRLVRRVACRQVCSPTRYRARTSMASVRSRNWRSPSRCLRVHSLTSSLTWRRMEGSDFASWSTIILRRMQKFLRCTSCPWVTTLSRPNRELALHGAMVALSRLRVAFLEA